MKLHKGAEFKVLTMSSLLLLAACQNSANSGAASPSTSRDQPQPRYRLIADERGQMSQTGKHQQRSEGQGIKLYPVDEGLREQSFRVFREELLEATKKHDVNYVLSILAPNILNSLGGDGGINEFKQQWKPDRPDSELWETLSTILSNGGSFESDLRRKHFCAPYVSSQWRRINGRLPNDSDALDYAAIIERNVAMRREPSSSAPVVTSLSYDVVKVDSGGSVFDETLINSYTWFKVTTLAGVEGYVSAQYVRGPSDYHACFEKIGEKWIMTILVAGE